MKTSNSERTPHPPYQTPALFIILFLVPWLSACNNSQQEQKKTPAPGVLVVKVLSQDIQPSSEFIGRTFAVSDVSLQAQVSELLSNLVFSPLNQAAT